MTGFARINGALSSNDNNVSWSWEVKSVNGKGLDIKYRLPMGYDDLALILKSKAADVLSRGSVSVFLDVVCENNTKRVKIDEELLDSLTLKAVELSQKFEGQIASPSAAELLGLRGVVELEESSISDENLVQLKDKIVDDFVSVCNLLQQDRQKEGRKIKEVLLAILAKIDIVVKNIENIAEQLPLKLKEKLDTQLQQYAKDININEERIAQEIVLLVTRADIREEVDRLKTHIKSAYSLLEAKDAVGRRLDFLCQELNREANTTCSKATDILVTNLGMELKALIEQFREQVQNIE